MVVYAIGMSNLVKSPRLHLDSADSANSELGNKNRDPDTFEVITNLFVNLFLFVILIDVLFNFFYGCCVSVHYVGHLNEETASAPAVALADWSRKDNAKYRRSNADTTLPPADTGENV